MKNLLYKGIVVLWIFFSSSSFIMGQVLIDGDSLYNHKHLPKIEIMPFIKWDRYPEFTYSINTANSYQVKLSGISWGIAGAYKYPVRKNTYLKLGTGYYQLSFNNVSGIGRWGPTTGRIINYYSPFGLYIIYSTNKYRYNSILALIGIEQIIPFGEKVVLSGSLNISNYLSYLQYYRITQDYPTGPPKNRYVTNYIRNAGASADIQIGLSQQIGKLSIGPKLMLPVYSIWALDDAFPKMHLYQKTLLHIKQNGLQLSVWGYR